MQRRPRGNDDPDLCYARELNVKKRVVLALGGHEKLKSLSPEARAILLKPTNYGNSRTLRKGGMAARGMIPCVPAMLTQNRGKFGSDDCAL